MAASNFFARWSRPLAAPADHSGSGAPRLQSDTTPAASEQLGARAGAPASEVVATSAPPRVLTVADAKALDASSDFAPFMARGVDVSVQRLALKQLFAMPHFNVMDGLDTYVENFNTFVPMDAALVASLNHAKTLLDPLSQLLQPVMTLVERELPHPSTSLGQPTGDDITAGAISCTRAGDGTQQNVGPAS